MGKELSLQCLDIWVGKETTIQELISAMSWEEYYTNDIKRSLIGEIIFANGKGEKIIVEVELILNDSIDLNSEIFIKKMY